MHIDERKRLYKVYTRYGYGGQDGLMLNEDMEVGRCGGSDYVYFHPYYAGGKPKFWDQNLLGRFLKELGTCIPYGVQISASWDLTPQERADLEQFNSRRQV